MPENDGLNEIRQEGAALLGGAASNDNLETATERKAREAKAQADVDAKEAGEWAGVPYVFGSIICEAMPELAPVYTEEKCIEWGEKFLPVARHYGWTIGFVGVWLGAIGATWAMAKPTGQAIIARRKAAMAAERKPDDQKADAKSPGAGTEQSAA